MVIGSTSKNVVFYSVNTMNIIITSIKTNNMHDEIMNKL